MIPGPFRRIAFSRLGFRLLLFWLLAVVFLVVGRQWEPAGPEPLPAVSASRAARLELAKAAPATPPSGLEGRFFSRDDSWHAMRAALEQFHAHPDEPLYAAVQATCLKFQYPPSSLLAIDALAEVFGPGAISNTALNSISLVFLVVFVLACYGLARPALGPLAEAPLDHALIFAFALSYYPMLKSLALGQIQTWLSALFALALLAYVRGYRATAGVALAIIVSIKPQMALFLVWALLRRETRMATAIAATLAILGGISLLRYGLPVHFEYLGVLRMVSSGESYAPNQSLNGLLLRALHIGPVLDFSCIDFAPYHPVVRVGTLLGTLFFIGLALFYKPRWHANNPGASMAFAALCFTIASPIAWEHHYSILPPVFCVCLAALAAQPFAKQRWLWIGVAAAWLLSGRYAAVGALATTNFNFLQSYLFFGALCLLAVLHQLRRGNVVRSPDLPEAD